MSLPMQNTPRGNRALTLLLALCAGLLAASCAYFTAGRFDAQAGANGPRLVAVAARDIPARTPIIASMLTLRRLPAARVPEDSVGDPQTIIGRVALTAIPAGFPLTSHAVTPRSAALGLAYVVPVAQRAVTVALDPISGMAGLLKPGDHVDVLATDNDAGRPSMTRTVLQNIRVLAIGAQVATGATAAPAHSGDNSGATLQVTPQQAQVLVLAGARGKVQLILRPPDDSAQFPIPALRSAAAPVASAKRAPAPARPPAALKPQAAPVEPGPVLAVLPLLPTVTVVKGTDSKTVRVSP